jgi:hypothetical protein
MLAFVVWLKDVSLFLIVGSRGARPGSDGAVFFPEPTPKTGTEDKGAIAGVTAGRLSQFLRLRAPPARVTMREP